MNKYTNKEVKISVTTTINLSAYEHLKERAMSEGRTLTSILRDILTENALTSDSLKSTIVSKINRTSTTPFTPITRSDAVDLSNLPEQFTNIDIVRLYVSLGKSARGAEKRLARCVKSGEVEKLAKGVYKKVMNL